MARRQHVWLRWNAGWSACFFMAGCLTHSVSDPEKPFAGVGPNAALPADRVELTPASCPPVDPPPPVLSPYGARPAEVVPRMASSV